MSPVRILYLAHPVAGDVRGNIDRALRWLAYLQREMASNAITAPWIPNLLAGEDDNDPTQRERGLRDCIAIASRCDGIILAGGSISSGMQRELDAVAAKGGLIVDLTHMGAEPPTGDLP